MRLARVDLAAKPTTKAAMPAPATIVPINALRPGIRLVQNNANVRTIRRFLIRIK
jgi:hypothetical protein